MRTIEITAYKATELDQPAFQYAYNKWQEGFHYPWYSEIRQCREGLLGIFPGAYLDRDNDIRTGQMEPEQLEIKGRRLAAWINSNVIKPLQRGKCTYKGNKRRKSNLTFAIECPFSGMTVDCAALDPLLDFVTGKGYPRKGQKWESTTLDDLIGDCSQAVKEYLREDFDYLTSENSFKEDCEANEIEFDESGRIL